MNGDGPDEPDEPDESGWLTTSMEVDSLIGQVVGRAFDAEWAALGGGPSAVPVRPAGLLELLADHQESLSLGDEMKAVLRLVGFERGEFPQLTGKVDARGRVMLMVGGISEATARALIALLVAGFSAREAIRPATDAPEGIMTIGVELDGRDLG